MAIFFDFSKMAAVRHLGFVMCVCSDHPRTAFDGLYRCAKFGRNRCTSLNSFDNMHVVLFREFGLKTPIHATKLFFLGGGILPPKWAATSTKPKKAHPCASPSRPRRLSNHARKSIDASDL